MLPWARNRNNPYDQADRVALEHKCGDLISKAFATSIPGPRLDAAENPGIFFAQQLAHIKTKAYDKLYPELIGMNLFPMSRDGDEVAA